MSEKPSDSEDTIILEPGIYDIAASFELPGIVNIYAPTYKTVDRKWYEFWKPKTYQVQIGYEVTDTYTSGRTTLLKSETIIIKRL